MRAMLYALLVAALVSGVTGCGTKGVLKTPKQAASEAQKKEREKARLTEEKATKPAEAAPPMPAAGEPK